MYEECEVFAKSDTDIGIIPDFQMDIHLTDEVPVNQAYRHLPRKLYDDVKNYLNDLIVNGWIQESESDYASPIVCVRKKDNSLRMCVDYRKLNLKTIADRQPIPRVQDLLDGLHGQRYFSTLDMAKAYHQGFIRDVCRKYTAFSTPWALFEWLRIPFGLKNAPAAFQKYINKALSGLLDKVCMAYLDDILIYGRTFQEQKTNLRRVLKRLKSKGVKLRVEKCEFVKPEVRYLGRLVSAEGYRADPEDVKALEKFRAPPKNVGDVRSLLGFLGYYRNYVKDFARKLKPVYDLLKTDTGPENPTSKAGTKGYNKRKSVEWNEALQARVDDVIDTLRSPVVMAFPDFESPFILNTDASGVGLGAVLYQQQGDEKLHKVISYASRTLNPAEQNYHLHSGKLEFLALKWAVCDKFSDYLGHGGKFTVFTDNNPLTYVMTTAKLNATGMRWVSDLAGYDFQLKYKPGKTHSDADGLSRNPLSDNIDVLARECTESVDRSVLSKVLTAPTEAVCLSVAADVLKFPAAVNAPESSLSKADLSRAQMHDPVIGPVHSAVLTDTRPNRREWQNFSNRSKLLFRQWKKLAVVDGVLTRNLSDRCQIVVPESSHQLVYTELHEKMGHLGLERVLDLARRRFFWPHMAADIDHYIKKKCSCVITKKPNVQERAPLVPIHATKPFEMISIDFLQVDKCKGGFEYILTVVDHFTRFAQAYPTRKNTSRAAADKIFNNFILQFGFPTRIHHDKGQEFNSNLFKQLHELTGIKMSNTTPYHPEGDGQCERLNRTIINMLKSIPENEKRSWKDHLAKLTFAYNATINKTTQFSPFYLLFGRCPRLPIDDIFPEVTPQSSSCSSGTVAGEKNQSGNNRENFGTYARAWEKKMTQAYEIANKNIGKAAQYNKHKHDQRSGCKSGVELSVGDRVVVKNVRHKGTTRAGKLASYWNPVIHEVTDRQGKLPVYVVRELDAKGKKSKTLHRNLLKEVNELVPVSDPVGSSVQNESVIVQDTVPMLPSIPTPTSNTGVNKDKSVNVKCLPRRKKRSSGKQVIVRNDVGGSSSSDSEDEIVVVRRKPVAPCAPGKPFFLQGRGERRSALDLPVAPERRSVLDLPVAPLSPVVENVAVVVAHSEESVDESEPDFEPVEEDGLPRGLLLSDVESEVGEGVEVSCSDAESEVRPESEEDVETESEDDGNETIQGTSLSEWESSSVYEDAASSIDHNESFQSTFNDSLDLEPDISPPVRRSNRPRKAPKKLVYDELGVPGFKSSTARVRRPKDSKFK